MDGKEVLVDVSDHFKIIDRMKDFEFYFKYHYSERHHDDITGKPKPMFSNHYPLTPISFLDWEQYYSLRKKIKYIANGKGIVRNNQIPKKRALERRQKVQDILRRYYPPSFLDFKIHKQSVFFTNINETFISVCVPGARETILDRGQLQYMGFGCPTISPHIDTMLNGFRKLNPSIHYIECKKDYSDLIEIIEWCKVHRKECIQIGKNAKALFEKTATPIALVQWIQKVINE